MYIIVTMIGLFVLAYIGAGVLAHFMSVWNRKAYWLWFKNVAKKRHGDLLTSVRCCSAYM